jgi:hypothetical protein
LIWSDARREENMLQNADSRLMGSTSINQNSVGSVSGVNYDSGSKNKKKPWYSNITLQSFDLYQKIEEDYKVKTSVGGYLSVIGWIIVFIMLIVQTYYYLTPHYHEHMVVDTSLEKHININIDITFHALTCAEAHLDAMDVAGDNQLNMEDKLFKQRISPSGEIIGEMTKATVGSNVKVESKGNSDVPEDKDKCLSCYGAESPHRRCCNSCKELKEAYQELGWSINEIMKTSEQCLAEPSNPFANVQKGEGCRVWGSMKINKVSGNIHIAHGESIVRDGRHIHQFLPQEAPGYNISHTIHSFSFGSKYPSMPKGALDGVKKIVTPAVGTGLFQYFIKIIPTSYTDRFLLFSTSTTSTNQYTVTERFRPLMLPQFPRLPDGTPDFQKAAHTQVQAILPGIFFVYDLSPFSIEVIRDSTPFSHYFTKVCATVGGVFTVMGVVDKIIFKMQKFTKQSANLK